MTDETFFQRYAGPNGDVTCWWAIRDEDCSFLVIDETNGLAADTSFKLSAGDDGNIGILTCNGAEQILNGTGAVVHITAAGAFTEAIQMTAGELTEFLSGGEFPLTLLGACEFTQGKMQH